MYSKNNDYTSHRHFPAGSTEVRRDNLPGVVYLYASAQGKVGAIAYHGKAGKPDWHYLFRNEEQRAAHVDKFFAGLASMAEYKAKEKAAKVAFVHDWKVGEILENSWGYDQTNIDFYQVTRIVGAQSVAIRQICSREVQVDGDHWLTGHVVPDPDNFKGPELIKRVQAAGSYNGGRGSISMEFGAASFWNGKPTYYTAYA